LEEERSARCGPLLGGSELLKARRFATLSEALADIAIADERARV
jgi:hypothetical protein